MAAVFREASFKACRASSVGEWSVPAPRTSFKHKPGCRPRGARADPPLPSLFGAPVEDELFERFLREPVLLARLFPLRRALLPHRLNEQFPPLLTEAHVPDHRGEVLP